MIFLKRHSSSSHWQQELRHAFWGLIFGACAGATWAQTPCPGHQEQKWPDAQDVIPFDQMLEAATATCGLDPAFLAFRGAWLLIRGDAEQAAIFLERALMLNPDLAGAQVDYAAALAATGERASAVALWKDLLQREDLPTAVRRQIEARLTQPETLPTTPWSVALSLTARLGHDTNLNGAPLSDQLTLTLPDGDALLALGEAYRPRSGSAALMDLRLTGQRSMTPGTNVLLSLDARQREAPASRYQQIESGLAFMKTWSPRATSVMGLHATAMRYEGQRILAAQRLLLAHDRHILQPMSCKFRVGLELETRRYPISTLLNGRYGGALGQLQCASSDFFVSLGLRGGTDHADSADRAGGHQRRQELKLQTAMPLGSWRVDAEFSHALNRDTRQYSPVLEQGAMRWQQRQIYKIELSKPVSTRSSLFLAAESIQQTSNLSLFESKGTTFWLGTRVQLK